MLKPGLRCCYVLVGSESGYELPYSERQESTQKENGVNTATGSNITDHLCPVCGQPLELYEYTKENQQKQMLRCSDAQARRRMIIKV